MANAKWLGASANWNTPSDWSTGHIPGTADTAIISAPGTYTIDVTSAAAAGVVLNDANAVLAVEGSLGVAGTFAAHAGTLALSGAILGGTLDALGADVIFAGGTLDGVTYAGSLVLSGSSSELVIAGAFANIASGGGPGTIGVSAGALLNVALNTTLPALLGAVDNSGGTLEISGTLNDAGQTLAVASGGPFNGLLIAGMIEGGAVALQGGSLAYDGGTLDGVSVKGPLDLSADFSSIGIMGGISLQSTGGGVDGVTVTGLLGGLVFLDSETLANASVTLGGADQQDGIFADASLTFAASVSITEQGTLAEAAFEGAGTITNQGTITAAPDDEVFVDAAGFTNADRLVVAAGGTLMAADPVTFDNRGLITAGAGAALDFAETSPLGNEGTFILAGATMIAGSAVSGSGAVDLSAGAVIAADGTVAAQQIAFLDATDALDLARPGAFGGTISGFRQGDAIVLENTTISSLSYASGVLTARGTIGGSVGMAALHVTGSYKTGDFTFAADGLGDTVITTDKVACFAAGTRLLTPSGEAAIEELSAGDLVLTLAGQPSAITWIGHMRLDPAGHPAPSEVSPILIARGAIAEETPRRDLFVSPDHALFLDGILIPAKVLVNGASIRFSPRPGAVTYFHVELARHDVLLAEGMPAESYLDTGNRACFVNAAIAGSHPGFRVHGQSEGCAPLLVRGPRVEAIRARLLARAAALDYRMTEKPDLRLAADGRGIRPSMVEAGTYLFRLPAAPKLLAITSRAGAPADVMASPDDRRVLGVAISRIVVHSRSGARAIALDDAALNEGWHGLETDGARAWRWTNGNARLPCPIGGEAIEISVSGTLPYRMRAPQPGRAAVQG